MPGCPIQTFDKIDTLVWMCLVARAREYGVAIEGNSGEVASHGGRARWNYDPQREWLEIEVLKLPFPVSCAQAAKALREAVASC
ncbi:MAG: hypothetical protein KF730_10855 [Sphingomonas sp.]|uniref:hypothetical protein n=1 Tax=Sphingomonas sp. TaxID=28214 RepID=UPI0025F28C11|nr:hypothetical protein [Sphingomonas sp.]MBX3565061.1 hypothetical protein [Sphingomonas sp.]